MIKPRNENPEGMGRSKTSSGISKKSPNTGLTTSTGKPMSAIELSRHTRDEFVIDENNCYLDRFKWFIGEREKIRLLKEQGCPRPWTDDEVLDKTKFTNIYRQDDKVSKFIYEMVGHLRGPILIYNLLMSRLINRVDALDRVLPLDGSRVPEHLLEGDAVFMNAAAYQVSPMMRKLDGFITNRETIVYYPIKVYEDVYEAITSQTDIAEAVYYGNKAYGGHIPFTMFQVVLDYHYLTNHFDDNSNVPVGQGAKSVVEVLGGLEFLSRELEMKKWDVEHAACEFRKYLYRQDKVLSKYSYKPNSMGITK